MGVRLRRIAVVAIFLLFVGLVLPAVYAHWIVTGTIVGLEMPFSVTALVFGGTGLLAFVVAHQIAKRTAKQVSSPISENAIQEYRHSRRQPLANRVSRLPSFGLLYAMMLGTVLLPGFLIYIYVWGHDHPAVGIRVYLVKPGALRSPTDFRPAPLVVHIESMGLNSRPRLYLNSEPISWDELSNDLKTHLKTGAEWLVYVEADSNVSWADAVNAMDIIRAAGAKVVLLTTETTSPHTAPHQVRQP